MGSLYRQGNSMKKFTLLVVLLLICAVPAIAGRRTTPNKDFENKVNGAKALNKIENIKSLLSNGTVNRIDDIAEYRAYQKKINKILRFLLQDYIGDID